MDAEPSSIECCVDAFPRYMGRETPLSYWKTPAVQFGVCGTQFTEGYVTFMIFVCVRHTPGVCRTHTSPV